MIRPAVIAPNHSVTYRWWRPACSAMSAMLAGPILAMVSNRPVRWPIEAIRHRAPWFRTSTMWSANAATRSSSMVPVAGTGAAPVRAASPMSGVVVLMITLLVLADGVFDVTAGPT